MKKSPMTNILVTQAFAKDWDSYLGSASINTKKIPKGVEFHFEPGFIKKKNGQLELTDISLVPDVHEFLPSDKKEIKKAYKFALDTFMFTAEELISTHSGCDPHPQLMEETKKEYKRILKLFQKGEMPKGYSNY
jgi:hypothetical protein